MPPINKPEYTQFPNALLESVATLAGSEFKVMAVIVRETFGFQRNEAALSIAYLVKATGLSDQGVRNAVEALNAQEYIETVSRQSKPTIFRVKFEGDPQDFEKKYRRPPYMGGKKSDSQGVNSFDPLGEEGARGSNELGEGVNSVDPRGQLSLPPTPVLKKSFKKTNKKSVWSKVLASIHNTHYSGNKWVEKRDIWNHYWASTTGEVVDDQLIVTCQDSDAAAWLENRGARLIQQALVGQGLGEMEIMFKAERAP